jgi:hypothetical protein
VDGLSPATRALLERARNGDRLDGDRREALRRGVATALGVEAAGNLGTPSTPRAPAARWALRTFGALGATGAALVVVAHLHGALGHGPSASPSIGPRVVAPVAPSSSPVATSPSADVGGDPAPTDVRADPAPVHLHGGSAPAAPRVPAPGVARPAAPEGDALAAEARLLAAAQSALDQGRGAQALGVLDEHDRRFPSGVLAPESEALRVDALCAAGRADDARAEALRLRARYPAAPRRLPASCVGGTQ